MNRHAHRRRGGGSGNVIALLVVAVIGLAAFLVYKTQQENSGEKKSVDEPVAEKQAPAPPAEDTAPAPATPVARKANLGDNALSADDQALMALYDQLTDPKQSTDTTVRVQLKQKVDDPTLKKIAAQLSRKHAGTQRVEFLAPDARPGDKPLATAVLADAANITIEKTPAHDAIASALKKAEALGPQLVGVWREQPDDGPLVMLYNRNGELHLETAYPDGSSTLEKVNVRYKGELRTYTPVNPKVPGLYYRLGPKNILEMHDTSGPVKDFQAVDSAP
ncbi:MAG: hypothetical protein R3236_01465 [Phycisphaeraceae bacterium]|nr:hypothetical protein [Phycisphaeraceae bacterium]